MLEDYEIECLSMGNLEIQHVVLVGGSEDLDDKQDAVFVRLVRSLVVFLR
jgi:hypothetical protein